MTGVARRGTRATPRHASTSATRVTPRHATASVARRLALGALVVAAVLLLASAPALAAAGGGSSGFGGGGGGGRGAGLYVIVQLLIRLALFGHGAGALILIALVVGYLLLTNVMPKAQRAWSEQQRTGRAARRRVTRRARRVELAAAEAAEDDPAFAPDRVHQAAARLFADVQAAWSAGDRQRLRSLVGSRLLQEWERRLDDFERRGWRNHVEVLGAPKVEYVGLTRRGGGHDGRVVVRIEATLRDFVVDRYGDRLTRGGRLTENARVREFWTLGRAPQAKTGWRLLSIEQGTEGRHVLEEDVVATPWADERALRDEALIEAAAADAVPSGTRIAELADLSFDGDARAAALDMSLVDGRFAPDVLEVSARRAVAAWADAIDGDDRALRAIAAPRVVDTLLHPGDPTRSTRLVVRGPSVKQIRITGFHADATPPLMTVEVRLEGARYVEDRATAAVVAGNPARIQAFVEHWTFALSDDAAQPWRLLSADAPLAAR